jgi:hypothetical protein
MRPLHVPVAGPAPARQPGWRAVAGVAAAGLLAGGRAGAGPVGLLAVGPLAVALGSAATGRLVAAWGRSPWWGLSFALVPGVVVGVAFATAEPLALALAALGLSLVLDRRPVPAGLAFAGAALTKESYLAFAVAAAAWLAIGGGRRRARLAGRRPWSSPAWYCSGCGGRTWPGGSRPAPPTPRPPARSGRRSPAPRDPARLDRAPARPVRAVPLRRAARPVPLQHACSRPHRARRRPGHRGLPGNSQGTSRLGQGRLAIMRGR